MLEPRRLAAGLLGLTGAAVLGAAASVATAVGAGAPGWLRYPFRLICHGIAERSFEIGGAPLPVCGRCSGIYVGLVIAAAAMLFLPWLRRHQFPTALAIVLAAPLAIDGTLSALRLIDSGNIARFATGVAFAFPMLLWPLSRIRDVPVEQETEGGPARGTVGYGA